MPLFKKCVRCGCRNRIDDPELESDVLMGDYAIFPCLKCNDTLEYTRDNIEF